MKRMRPEKGTEGVDDRVPRYTPTLNGKHARVDELSKLKAVRDGKQINSRCKEAIHQLRIITLGHRHRRGGAHGMVDGWRLRDASGCQGIRRCERIRGDKAERKNGEGHDCAHRVCR